ncbi:DUF4383 domain-containing protein [Pleurocapsales cyanobacterium LEGE 10410]|nr:DUF4383 domain-containing protein [Pleurocapsales cyanobacterium LEGE 10410]
MKLQQTCALTLGILFLILGIAGFIPAFTTIPGETFDSGIPLDADSLYTKGFSLLLGVFPTNLIHNLFHVFVGILGIAASKTGNGRLFNQIFGIMPIFGNNIWWNGLTGAIAAYYGFFAKNPTASTEQINA